jgi:oxalate decarboxylase
VTVRELPVSKSIAGVNMRLTAGGVRELHWHTAGEWAIMLYGTARITAIDADGRSFVADVKQNDLWYFPSGTPHSIQGLDPDGTEFMLVFDDGTFSEQETVLLSDSMAHLPPEVLAKNFGVAEQAMSNLPKQELFIFQTDVPGPLDADQKAAAGSLGPSPTDFAFRTMDMPPTKTAKGGEVRIVDSSKFKVSTTIAMAMVTVHPGGLRELHWHPNADEWQYYIAGKGRMTVVDTGNKGRTLDFSGRGCRIRGKEPAALRREYRGYGPDLPGEVQEQLLPGLFAVGVAVAHAAGIGHGAPEDRSGNSRRDTQE